MIASAAAGLACGAILGGRFKVFILVPAHLLAFGIVIVVAVSGHQTAAGATLACVVWSLGCNVGYVAAALVAAAIDAPRRHREPVPPLHRARP